MSDEPKKPVHGVTFGDHRDKIQAEARRLVDDGIIGARITINVGNITLDLDDYPSGFRAVPMEERNLITAMTLKFQDHTFVITRKLKDGTKVPGFFYHIKQGRKIIMGKNSGVQFPLETERIGFCYSKNGDSAVVDMSYLTGNVDFGQENMVQRRVNISLFGDLEQLEVSQVPPRILMNNEDLRLAHIKTQ